MNACRFGCSLADSNYFTNFHNPVFSFFTAERRLILYSQRGIHGVTQEAESCAIEE